MECEFKERKKIIPPKDESAKDRILEIIGYEEREAQIGGVNVTILVKKPEPGKVGIVGEAIVGKDFVG